MSLIQPGAASTTPKRRQRAQALPVSSTVAKLIAQIQAEAEAATLAALSAKDGILVLQPIDRGRARFKDEGHSLTFRDVTGAKLELWRRYTCPKSWEDHPNRLGWHPSHWDVSVERLDGAGVVWTADLGFHVTDDFGNLVAVQS